MMMRSLGFRCFLILGLMASCAWARSIGGQACNFDGTNADGRARADLGVFDPNTANWFIFSNSNGPALAFPAQWGFPGAAPAPGDYDGDRVGDLSVYHRDSGNWYIRSMKGTVLAFPANWGWSEADAFPADYDGDGRTDLGVYNRTTGMWFVRSLAGAVLTFGKNWGWTESVPVPADYDGDGRANLAVYHRRSGTWYIDSPTGVVAFARAWGWNGAWAVPGDYDGDGSADLAVYDRAGGKWYIQTLAGSNLAWGVNWGWAEATPVPADYDGDGRTDLAVYDRKSGLWYIRTLNGTTLAWGVNWGWKGAVPIQTYALRSSEGLVLTAFGDSITYGEGSLSGGPTTAYPVMLEKKLNVQLGGYFITVNKGKSGEYTWKGKLRLPSVLDEMVPDMLLLMEGVNDALYDYMFDATEFNLGEMIAQAQARGAKAILATVPPTIKSDYADRSIQAGRIRAFNPYVYNIGEKYNIPIAEVYDYITSSPDWEQTMMDQETANHPSPAGHLKVRDAFYDAFMTRFYEGSYY
jgi:lysophospholipase L1-like esterase